MAESVADDESEFGSVTSSQKSFLKNCPFAVPHSPPTISSDGVLHTYSDSTEVLGNPISPPVLSFSSPTSLDSINDEDVFRTPPENASLSSAVESEPRVRVSEMKPRGGGSKLKSPSSTTETTPVFASPSLPAENGTEVVAPLSSPPSFAAGNIRVPRKPSDLDSPSPIAIGRVMVLENQPVSDSTANTGDNLNLNLVSSSPSATEGIKITERDNPGDGDEIAIPFKDIIEALLRSSGENLYERDDEVSYVDILKLLGHKLP